MDTNRQTLFRFPALRTALIVLVALQMLLIMPLATQEADALTWENDYIVSSGSVEDYQRLDAEGDNVYVVYSVDIRGITYCYMRWYNGTAWSAILPVSGTTVVSSNVVVEAANGGAHCVYTDWTDRDGDVMYTFYDGKTWTTPYEVSDPRGLTNAIYPDIDVDDGTVHIVWQDYPDGDSDIFHRSFDGSRWSGTSKVNLDVRNEHQVNPAVAAADGDVHVVWRDYADGDADIFYRHYNGTWNTITQVSRDAGLETQAWPQVVVTPQGVHVFYSDQQTTLDFWTYMTTYDGTWSSPKYVGAARAKGSEQDIQVAAEGDHIVLAYMLDRVPNNIIYRHFNGLAWDYEQNVNVNAGSDAVTIPDIDLEKGVAHLVYSRLRSSARTLLYTSTALDATDPWAEVEERAPYWMEGGRMLIDWRAGDDYGLASVTLQYRYSQDNATWDRWTMVSTKEVSGLALSSATSFTPTDGDGYYEFRAYATDITGKTEAPSMDPEAMGGLDTVDPIGGISINNMAAVTTNSTVTLLLTYIDETSGVNAVRFNDDTIGGDEPWENPVPTKEWELGTAEGEYTVAYQVMDISGRLSPIYTDTIFLDTTDPYGTITMTIISEWTNTRDVDLDLTYGDTGSGVAKVRFADEAVGGDEPWDNPVETKRWTLPEGEGMHTIAYQVMDAAGRVSEVYTTSISLDTVAPTGSIIMGGSDTFTTERTVTLTLTAEDVTSGVAGIRVLNEAVGGDEPWDNKVDNLEWELTEGSGLKTVYYQIIDVAGLTSEVYTATITLDVDDPTGSIIMGGGDTLVNTAIVDLALTYDDATSTIVGIRIQEEAVGGDEPWDNPVEALEFTLSAGDGEKTIYFQVIDEAGRESQVYSVSFTLDTSNPFVVDTDPLPLAEKVPVDKVISVRFSEIMNSDSVERAFTLSFLDGGVPNNVGGTFDWSPDGKTLTFTPLGDLSEGTLYSITVTDAATDAADNTLFPPLVSAFTTVGGDGGNGDNGDGDGLLGGLLLILMVAFVVIAAVVIATIYYFAKFGVDKGDD